MTQGRPIDASIKAYIDKYIDEKIFGIESLELREHLEAIDSRLETLELLDFQGQISKLSDTIINLESQHLDSDVHSVYLRILVRQLDYYHRILLRYVTGYVSKIDAGLAYTAIDKICDWGIGRLQETQKPLDVLNQFVERVEGNPSLKQFNERPLGK